MIAPDADGSTAAWDWYFDKVKYDGTDEYARASIAATLAPLPEEVAAWAVEAVAFTSVGGETWGHTLSLAAANSDSGRCLHVASRLISSPNRRARMRTRRSPTRFTSLISSKAVTPKRRRYSTKPRMPEICNDGLQG